MEDDVSLLVWDTDEKLPPVQVHRALWQRYAVTDTGTEVSVPQLVEDNADRLRSEYLALVYELGETKISGKRVVDHLEIRPGFSYWWMTLLVEKCNFAKSPQINNAIKLLAFKEWIGAKDYEHIFLVSSNAQLAESLRLLADELALGFEWQEIKQQRSTRSLVKRIYGQLPHSLQALVRFAYNLSVHWPLKGVGVEEWKKTKSTTLFVSYSDNQVPDTLVQGKFESRYWAQLPSVVEKAEGMTAWLHLYVSDHLLPSAAIASKKFAEINENSKGKQVHTTLFSFLGWRCVVDALGYWMLILRVGSALEEQFATVCGALWPLLRYDYRSSLFGSVSLNNLLVYVLFERALSILPKHKIGLYLQENQEWEFSLVNVWKNSSHGKLIGVPHTSIRYWDMRYYCDPRNYDSSDKCTIPLPDVIAINGEAAKKQCVDGGLPERLLQPVEALRYLYLADQSVPKYSGLRGGKQSKTILVLGDYVRSNTVNLLNLVGQCAESLRNTCQFIIKFHPNCVIDVPENLRVNYVVSDKPIIDLLLKSDIAVTGSSTSAAVDAYCFEIPVITILDPATLNLSPLRGLNGVKFVGSASEFCSAVEAVGRSDYLSGTKDNFFYLCNELPRWKKLLGI